MKNRYFWIACSTPFGFIDGPWKGTRTPLHKQEADFIRQNMARQCSMAAGGQIIPEGVIRLVSAIEMDAEAAESYFPQDFKPLVDIS